VHMHGLGFGRVISASVLQKTKAEKYFSKAHFTIVIKLKLSQE